MNPPAAPSSSALVAQGSACLFRNGYTPVRGLAQLKRGLPRPSFTIVSDGLDKFSVSLAGPVRPRRDGEDSRNVLFDFPTEPFDQIKLCFDSPINADNFYRILHQIEESMIAAVEKPRVVYRPSANAHRERVCSQPTPPHAVQPRPISFAPTSTVIREHLAKLSMEAPASLAGPPPPPPPRRDSSLRQDPQTDTPSPRSSSLPSTSTLKPPSENRSSHSLDLNQDSAPLSDAPTLKASSHSNQLHQPHAHAIHRKSLVVEDDLEIFHPADLTFIRHLERGSQGAVDLVSTKFYRRVAVKYFDQKVKQWQSAATRELFYLLKTVTHPNIVQTRGVLFASSSQRDKPLGILMEYMDCGSVHQAIYTVTRQYTLTDPLNWCRQAASALAFLHKKRLVHRDVKPANMLLSDGGNRLKISDFGLCVTLDTGMTADVGTVVYMAPEVVGSSAEVNYNETCDVYSLGVAFWEMLHRRRPYDGFGFLALLSAVRQGTRPTFDMQLCSMEVKHLIERMWSEEASLRPQMEEVFLSVADMLERTGFFGIYE